MSNEQSQKRDTVIGGPSASQLPAVVAEQGLSSALKSSVFSSTISRDDIVQHMTYQYRIGLEAEVAKEVEKLGYLEKAMKSSIDRATTKLVMHLEDFICGFILELNEAINGLPVLNTSRGRVRHGASAYTTAFTVAVYDLENARQVVGTHAVASLELKLEKTAPNTYIISDSASGRALSELLHPVSEKIRQNQMSRHNTGSWGLFSVVVNSRSAASDKDRFSATLALSAEASNSISEGDEALTIKRAFIAIQEDGVKVEEQRTLVINMRNKLSPSNLARIKEAVAARMLGFALKSSGSDTALEEVEGVVKDMVGEARLRS